MGRALIPRVRTTATIAAAVVLVAAGGFAVRLQEDSAPPTHQNSAPTTKQDAGRRITLFGTTLRPIGGLGGGGAGSLARVESRIGRPEILRLYDDGLPSSWSELSARADGLPLVISFKADPAGVLAGEYDEALTAWFSAAPKHQTTYWVYHHEPEDEVESGQFTSTQFRQAWQYVAELAASADNPRLKSTVVLMCWTVHPSSGRNWEDYVDAGTVDVLAWDCYNHGVPSGEYRSPASILDRAIVASNEAGAGWGVAELGSLLAEDDDGQGRAQWLLDVGAYAVEHRAAFITYFDSPIGGDYVLDDQPSQDAFRTLVAGEPKPGQRGLAGVPLR